MGKGNWLNNALRCIWVLFSVSFFHKLSLNFLHNLLGHPLYRGVGLWCQSPLFPVLLFCLPYLFPHCSCATWHLMTCDVITHLPHTSHPLLPPPPHNFPIFLLRKNEKNICCSSLFIHICFDHNCTKFSLTYNIFHTNNLTNFLVLHVKVAVRKETEKFTIDSFRWSIHSQLDLSLTQLQAKE